MKKPSKKTIGIVVVLLALCVTSVLGVQAYNNYKYQKELEAESLELETQRDEVLLNISTIYDLENDEIDEDIEETIKNYENLLSYSDLFEDSDKLDSYQGYLDILLGHIQSYYEDLFNDFIVNDSLNIEELEAVIEDINDYKSLIEDVTYLGDEKIEALLSDCDDLIDEANGLIEAIELKEKEAAEALANSNNSSSGSSSSNTGSSGSSSSNSGSSGSSSSSSSTFDPYKHVVFTGKTDSGGNLEFYITGFTGVWRGWKQTMQYGDYAGKHITSIIINNYLYAWVDGIYTPSLNGPM